MSGFSVRIQGSKRVWIYRDKRNYTNIRFMLAAAEVIDFPTWQISNFMSEVLVLSIAIHRQVASMSAILKHVE